MQRRSDAFQRQASAGAGAWFLTVFALIWNGFVWSLLISNGQVPLWFKGLFVLVGAAVAAAALAAWAQRLRGGSVTLALSLDPVEHGRPVQVRFEVPAKTMAGEPRPWQVQARLESTTSRQSGFGCVWQQTFTARPDAAGRIVAEVVLPADMPSTAASDGDTTYRSMLTLGTDNLTWDFEISTVAATSATLRQTGGFGPARPAPGAGAAAARPFRPAWLLLPALMVALTVWHLFGPQYDLRPWDLLRAAAGMGALSTRVQTGDFELRVTNLLVNDWARLGRLHGTARVDNGVLSVRVDALDVQPVGNCEPRRGSCVLQSVSLLLSGDKDTSFETLASSDPLPVGADLYDLGRWSLPAAQRGHVFRLTLPRAIDIHNARLKLAIVMADGATTYPAHGDTLALHRALSRAAGRADPCTGITPAVQRAQAGCPPAASPQQPAALAPALLAALESENWDVATALLDAGADANARADSDPYTPLGYAAAGNHLPLVERLLRDGADPSVRRVNRQGQTVTPLSQALRTDAAPAVAALLRAGARPDAGDRTGWTTLHIAAYSSANESLRHLAAAGADMNERTPADRQQTVLQTALQFGSAATIQTLMDAGADPKLTDKRGKDACDWAREYGRSDPVRAMVCATR